MKIYLTILGLLLGFVAQAQQLVKIGQNVIITLPDDAIKYRDEKYAQQLMEAFKSKEVTDKLLGNAYDIGDMRLYLRSKTNTSESEYVRITKMSSYSILHNTKSKYKSTLMSINRAKVEITFKESEGSGDYYFSMYSKKHSNTFIFGSLHFKTKDKEEALKHIYAMLNGVVFE